MFIIIFRREQKKKKMNEETKQEFRNTDHDDILEKRKKD